MGSPSSTSAAPTPRNRWVVRHIWRAFPELDTYSDDECRTFVRAVRRERILTAIRALLLAAAPTTAVVGGMIIAAVVYEWLETYSLSESVLGSTLQLTAVGLSMAAVGLVSALTCLVLRDWLLRRRLHAVLDVGGHCRGCGYSFIGLIIPESLRIRCPECGMESTVDGSLTLLSRGPDGTAVGARRVVIKEHPPFWTRERIRWWLRTAGIATAIVLAPVLLGLGVLEYAARTRAARAAADMPAPEEFTAILASAHPRATLTKAPQFMELCTRVCSDMMDLAPRSEQTDALGQPAPAWRDPNFVAILPDYDVRKILEADGDERSSRRRLEEEAAEAWASTLLVRAEEAGTFRRMKASVDQLPYEVRDAQLTSEALLGYRLDYMGSTRRICLALCARARLAVARGDTATAEESLTLALQIANLAAEQSFRIEGMVASHLRGLVFTTVQRWLLSHPTALELEAVERIMRAPGPRGDAMLQFDFEALQARGLLSTVFSDHDTIRRLLITGDMDVSRLRFGNQAIIKDAGTWEDNKAEVMNSLNDWRAAASGPPSAMGTSSTAATVRGPVGFALNFFRVPGSNPVLTEHAEVTMRSTIAAMVALERWRIRHGQYPDTLEALVPEVVPAVPLDPWSEQPMGYRRLDPASDIMQLPYLLYSHGLRGKPGTGPEYDPSAPLEQRSEGTMSSPNYLLNLHLPIPRGQAQTPAP